MAEYLEATFDKFTFRVATDRIYSSEGVWILQDPQQGVDRVRVGLSDYVQQHNGDVAFVHVKTPGSILDTGDDFAEIETMKATFTLPSPFVGTVAEINAALDQMPELVNQDPFDKGWLAVFEVKDWPTARASLLEPDAYFAFMRSQVEQELKQP
jgi:glycine cleavage system H protein